MRTRARACFTSAPAGQGACHTVPLSLLRSPRFRNTLRAASTRNTTVRRQPQLRLGTKVNAILQMAPSGELRISGQLTLAPIPGFKRVEFLEIAMAKELAA